MIATLGTLAVVIVYMTESHKRESSFSVQATQSTVPTKQAWGNEKAKTSGTSTAVPRPAVRNDVSPATLFTAADRLSLIVGSARSAYSAAVLTEGRFS